MCSTIFPRNPPLATSFKTPFRLPLNNSKWRRSPDTSRSGGEVESPRCYTRRIGWDSPNRPGSGKWTPNSLAPTFCVIAPALRTSIAKPTAFTAGCALARHSVSFPGTTASVFWRMAMLACVPRADWLRPCRNTVLPKGAHFWYKGDDGSWWLGKINASTTEDGVYLVRFLDDPGPIKVPLPTTRYTTSTGAGRGSGCLQVHVASSFTREIQRNVDSLKSAAVVR